MKIKITQCLFPLLLIIISIQGCKVHHVINYDPKRLGLEDDCQPSKTGFRYDSLLTPASLQTVKADTATIGRFSLRARNIATSVGAMKALNRFTLLERKAQSGSDSAMLALLFVRQEIDERLSLAVLDISSVLAELDCEQDRAIELRSYLQQLINKRVKLLNISSIVVGATATVVASGISLKNPDANKLIQGVSITGAALGGYWALRQIFIKREAYFSHHRNHLRELWENPSQSTIFPPNVWHFLNKEFDAKGRTMTGRKILLNQFKEVGALGQPDSQEEKLRVKLFFGEGGNYSIDELTDRINMLELLETEINLMKYDLKRLHQEILLKDTE